MSTNWNPKRYRAPSQRDTEQFLRDQLRKETEKLRLVEDRARILSDRFIHWRNVAIHLYENLGPCHECQLCDDVVRTLEDVD